MSRQRLSVSLFSRIQHRLGLAVGIELSLLIAIPVKAAETIFFDYGFVSRSLPVKALEAFAQMGEGSPELKSSLATLFRPGHGKNGSFCWRRAPTMRMSYLRMGLSTLSTGRLCGLFELRSAVWCVSDYCGFQ
ncbi:alpha/beta hydrolase [Leptolyngbya sp. KIOST-1]|uniref:alpha/beta hydrolase n=1 Tax=Leptolyngbya sp. KIOST-1 TaxID=1229172 RepID=UPI0009DEDB12